MAAMRNIVMIFVDSLRPDHLGCYGYERPTSPFLDGLAKRSLVLEGCYSASNFTAPAFTSVFTATYPSRHGIFDFFAKARQSAVKAACDAQGVRLGGVVTFRFFKNLLGNIWGPLEAVTDTRSFDYSKDLPRAVSESACQWLEHHGREGPFCLFLHYDGPHAPYRLPDRYATLFESVDAADADPDVVDSFFPQQRELLGASPEEDATLRRIHEMTRRINYHGHRLDPHTLQFLVDKYDASTRYNDEMLAVVYAALESLGLLGRTVLGVFSDHGEEFLDHGHLGHGGVHLYEEIIRTVGIIHDPAHPEARRSKAPVSHTQILPTLLELAGADKSPPDLRELDLRRTLAQAGQGRAPDPVFSVGEFKTAVRLGSAKWIRAVPSSRHGWLKRLRLRLRLLQIGEWRDEFFDLTEDPTEKTPLRGRTEQARPLAEALRRHLATAASAFAPGGVARDLSQAERQRIEQELRDLGYM